MLRSIALIVAMAFVACKSPPKAEREDVTREQRSGDQVRIANGEKLGEGLIYVTTRVDEKGLRYDTKVLAPPGEVAAAVGPEGALLRRLWADKKH